ncbi:3-methyladenine DNA glycosylase AlkD [Hathewaya proteolytica DSM 3090]|uniref:3-methyladenine DNA glycosylase AlkD n=1 Tax=Hathewaya proteolytica DSM 3090 TaxID=1121331 RepID=A0A1M6SXP9_9CLOT|nr:DNA alkylation repair protein [Hathewaya proteolytica]SHK49437.1 3-methyladenine DNA glycosylase AlkD [Hathewaya proteolytica DSM 3090]
MAKTVREQLVELAEEDYKIFSSRLLPNINNILGVCLPALRKIAKQIAAKDWRSYLKGASSEYFEEIMLQGMVIGYVKAEIEEIFSYVEDFVPKIDNWSVCDSFCVGLKITNQYKERVWEFLKPYYSSENEFEIRFCVVMLINYYIDEEYINQIFDIFNNIKSEGYYAKMGIAWAVSICYIKLPIATTIFLKKNNLDDYTYNKALQKITESKKVNKETKAVIRSMKRV